MLVPIMPLPVPMPLQYILCQSSEMEFISGGGQEKSVGLGPKSKVSLDIIYMYISMKNF